MTPIKQKYEMFYNQFMNGTRHDIVKRMKEKLEEIREEQTKVKLEVSIREKEVQHLATQYFFDNKQFEKQRQKFIEAMDYESELTYESLALKKLIRVTEEVEAKRKKTNS